MQIPTQFCSSVGGLGLVTLLQPHLPHSNENKMEGGGIHVCCLELQRKGRREIRERQAQLCTAKQHQKLLIDALIL